MGIFVEREAKPYHCGQICRVLRYDHQIALARLGRNVHQELREVFDQSSERRSWFLNGRLAAVGGVTGSLAAATGYIWLAISEEAAQHQISVAREIRRYVDRVMATKRELATTIIGGDEHATKLAIFLGFHVEDDGPGASAITRIGRRHLANHLDRSPDIHIPVGGGYVIGMGYHAPEWMG